MSANTKKRKLPDRLIDKFSGSVMGKFIGVRLGIPVEFLCPTEELMKHHPYITTYLVKDRKTYTDDDTNGYVYFAKLFEAIGSTDELTPEHVAKLILNYVPENRGFFWWKDSAESATYHNLLAGVPAGVAGDYEHIGWHSNGVGGQIFYDAIPLIFAGDPAKAAEMAYRVAKVTHNGEGSIGAQFLAGCLAATFLETEMEKIIETGLAQIDPGSNYAAMVRDILGFWRRCPHDWTACMHHIDQTYPWHHAWDYGSHVVMALLYGQYNFTYAMEICLKAAGDTDCNCGNVGAVLGAFLGLSQINNEAWVAPIRDVAMTSGAIPYENEVSLTQFTAKLLMLYAKFADVEVPDYIREAAKDENYAFCFPFSLQNTGARLWRDHALREDLVNDSNLCVECIEDVPSGSPSVLKFWAHHVKAGDLLRVYRPFTTGGFDYLIYEPSAATRLYPGQTVRVKVMTRYNTAKMSVCLMAYAEGSATAVYGERIPLREDEWTELILRLPDNPCHYEYINIELIPEEDSYFSNDYDGVDLYIDTLRIEGNPTYSIDFADNKDIVYNGWKYSLVRNFNICYGEAYQSRTADGREYLRIYTGLPNHVVKKPTAQPLTEKEGLFMAVTGAPAVYDSVFCEMSVVPEGRDPDRYGPLDKKIKNASLMLFHVKGLADAYAAGFFDGHIVIAKPDGTPGGFEVLTAEEFPYELNRRYRFDITIGTDGVEFTATETGDPVNHKTIRCQAEGLYTPGCIGFAGTGNYGITVYRYGVKGAPAPGGI